MGSDSSAGIVANSSSLLEALTHRIVVVDGAMGTMLQSRNLELDDFSGLEGCNEILNATRPDIVTWVHESYLDAGADAIETNTFGTNFANFAEYDIVDRIAELAGAGARLARNAADAAATPDRRRWVLGSMGPGTKLPTLGHAPFTTLRDAYAQQAIGMLDGGIDAVLVETCQDLLQAKAAIIGAQRAMEQVGRTVPVLCTVTVETTGTMLLGSEIGAALTALEPLGIDAIGLNCATGPAEMSEHLRYLSQHSRIPLAVLPNAGLPQIGSHGAVYPLGPDELAAALRRFATDYGTVLVGGCCGTTPEHIRALVAAVADVRVRERAAEPEPAVASLYQPVPFQQDASALMIGERTNANGSKAFRDAMLASDIDTCVQIARQQARDGSHVLDLCVDYVGRDGVADMVELASRFATASTLPIMLDSTEPAVIEAGLTQLGGRCIVNSVNYEDGDGPTSRFGRLMPLVVEYGTAVVALTIDEEGQARTAEWKLRVAERLIADLTTTWGMARHDIVVDTLTFPIATGQEETRRDAIETIAAIRELKQRYPDVQTTLGVSNVSFGLNPAARQVLNSVFLHECREAGLDSAIVHASKILPMNRIADEQREVALDLVYDRRRPESHPNGEYDPLSRFLELFEGATARSSSADRAAELAALPLDERLQRRIVDGEKKGLSDDLTEALRQRPAMQIINETLLAGMKTVGELFGSGQMQLPFVLQSAEVMKAAVAELEPHLEKSDSDGKGTIVLATVRGDVHDIGKNLVDIILSNNGYTVVNLGIKQPITNILDAAQQHSADVIGMSGLLVKSTVVMKDNLEEMNLRGVASQWPVLLGGAALTRAYVETNLAELYQGEVRYARDAFEGLRLMDALMLAKRANVEVGVDEHARAAQQQRRERHERSARIAQQRRETGGIGGIGGIGGMAGAAEAQPELDDFVRSDVAPDAPIPAPPFLGSRIVRGVPLASYAALLDERATFMGQWGLRGSRGGEGPSYEELVETEGRPRLRYWLDRLVTDQVLEAGVAYGYFRCVSERNDLVVLGDDGTDRMRFSFPRQRRDRRLCLADFFRSRGSGETDVVAFHVVTMGERISEYAGELFAAHSYRDYLEVHGLSVQLTEALAEYWHARIRDELGLAADDADNLDEILGQGYRGSRYSFGYPACPNVEDQAPLMELLQPERIGVKLSEEFQLHPEQSTSALIVHHPEAKYFNAR
ncbi:MAG: methionine synthase [Acidimicrobiales bacterium]|nr:MAG: methionine synthase [Acidimicrobiales bacterium]